MNSGIQGLGWFMRRTRDPFALAKFYEDALGLPRLRRWKTEGLCGVMLWVGDVGVLETNLLNKNAKADPKGSPCTPIFRSRDLAGSTARLATHGVLPIATERDWRATTRFFQDIDGLKFGIEQVNQADANVVDQYWENSDSVTDAMLPGGIAIDSEIDGLSRIIHSAPDVGAEAEFLKALGLTESQCGDSESVFRIGDSCLLDLRSDNLQLPVIEERDLMFDAWIMRVYGMQSFRDSLVRQNGKVLSLHEFDGGTLDYALTPANRVIGWQERKGYDPDVPTTQMVEDLHARSRWIRSQ